METFLKACGKMATCMAKVRKKWFILWFIDPNLCLMIQKASGSEMIKTDMKVSSKLKIWKDER